MSAALQPPPKSTPAQDAFLRDKLDIDPSELHEIEQERTLFSRFPPDFDTFTDVPDSVSLTPEQRKELDAAMAKMLARAEKMKAKMQAAGGPVDLDKIDTEVFGHIPRNFVPPQFKKELQDWRVTRDAMNDRAVKKMMDQSADPAATAQKVTGTLSTLSSIAGVGVQGAEMVKVFSPEKAEAIGAIIGYIGQGLDSTGTAIAGGKAAKERVTDDLGPVEQKMKDEKIISSLGTLMGTGVDIATEFVPLLGTLKSGAETVAALKETVERVRLRSATGDLRDEAMARVASQLSKAFDQAAGREGRLGAEAGVEATQKAIGTAAGVARDTGVGIKVAAALTIVEKTIMVGGKVVFAAIDWSEAEKAVKTLNDARAGSEKAQQLVFADHPHYAKMLIAIMAKKQDPLAMKYLVERGLTEQDINDQRTSIDILADYALEQSQETDEPKTLGQTIDGVLDTVRGGAEKLKGACAAAGKWLGLLKDNPKAVPPPLPQIYSADEIGKMRAALQDAKDKKAAAEKAGKDVPAWVEQNIKNLEAELARLARDLREQWNSVKAEQVNWDLIASGHAPPAKDGKAPNAEQAAKLRDEARIASAHLAELYQACVA